jgi:hypothetical protein
MKTSDVEFDTEFNWNEAVAHGRLLASRLHALEFQEDDGPSLRLVA